MMKITRTSPRTGIESTMELDITLEQYAEWRTGAYIQDAFPNLSADGREFINTGYTPEDWEAMYPEEEGDNPFEAYNAIVREFNKIRGSK